MQLRHGRNSRDAILAIELSDLAAIATVDVDEAVHIRNGELVDAVCRVGLPLRLEDRDPTTGLVVVGDRLRWREVAPEILSWFPFRGT